MRAFFLALLLPCILIAGCRSESPNHGFCGIIPSALEQPLAFAVFLYLNHSPEGSPVDADEQDSVTAQFPDAAFLDAETNRELRHIPPLEVRSDPSAINPIAEAQCGFSIFANDLKEAAGLTFAHSPVAYGPAENPETGSGPIEYRVYFNPDALSTNHEEAYSRSRQFLRTLWSERFQTALENYGLKPVPEALSEKMRNDLGGLFPSMLSD